LIDLNLNPIRKVTYVIKMLFWHFTVWTKTEFCLLKNKNFKLIY